LQAAGAFAAQLLESNEFRRAAVYFLSCHRETDAVNAYLQGNLFPFAAQDSYIALMAAAMPSLLQSCILESKVK
jgi:hypothetical protein